MPDHPETIALVTGANTGIGRVTARELARQGMHVFLACRSRERAAPALAEIEALPGGGKAGFLALDLGDLASVRACADAFLERGLPLHLLVNNGGLAGARGLTASGFEIAFGVNHVGHFALTRLLRRRLVDSAPARIVTVASQAHKAASGIDFAAVRRKTRSLTGMPEYQVSKLANVLFSAELGRQLQGSGVTTYSLHPGVVASDIWRKIPWPFRSLVTRRMISPEDGARTTIHCATSPEVAGETGLYYDRCAVEQPSAVAQDAELATRLWKESEDWTRAAAE